MLVWILRNQRLKHVLARLTQCSRLLLTRSAFKQKRKNDSRVDFVKGATQISEINDSPQELCTTDKDSHFPLIDLFVSRHVRFAIKIRRAERKIQIVT